MKPSVAACVSGELRTLRERCVGTRLTQHVLVPLQADTFVLVKLRNNWSTSLEMSIRRVFVGAIVKKLSITSIDQGRACQPNGHGGGYFQTIELFKCYTPLSLIPKNKYLVSALGNPARSV